MQDFTPFEKARTRVVLRHPFFGALVLRLRPVEDRVCQTAWVDGVRLGYNPEWFAGLSESVQEFVLCHEVMHVVLRHHTRRGSRNPTYWNVAGDHAINLILRDSGHTLWDKCLADPKYVGWDAYRIYDDVLPDSQDDPSDGDPGQPGDTGGESEDGSGQPGNQPGDQDDQSGNPGGAGQEQGGEEQGEDPGGLGGVRDLPGGEDGEPASEADRRESEAEWQIAAESAAKAAASRGKLPGNLRSLITELSEPEVNWREVLRDFVARCVSQDYTWTRPNRRHIAGGLYLPTLEGETLPPVVIGIDTSGSMSDETLAQAGGEIRSILSDFDTSVTVIYCDTRVNRVDQFDDPDDLVLTADGRGGTYLTPIFEKVEELVDDGTLEEPPSFMIMFTDLCIEFGIPEPDCPVIWATESKGLEGPFGETVFIDVHQK